MSPFSPVDRGTKKAAATTTTTSITLDATCNTVRVLNNSGALAFIRPGDATATSSDVPVLNGTVETFAGGHKVWGVILAAGAAGGDVYFTPGDGL